MHFAWHHKICSETFCFIYQWAPTKRPKPILKFLSVLCDKISTTRPQIPYGLDRSGIHIDKETGKVIPGKPGKGLTCATFILALFDTYRIRLLDEIQWPANANQAWQNYIYELMCDERSRVPEDHREALKNDIGGSRRFTPAEVVGASTENSWPVGFKKARRLAEKVAAEIRPFNYKIRDANC